MKKLLILCACFFVAQSGHALEVQSGAYISYKTKDTATGEEQGPQYTSGYMVMNIVGNAPGIALSDFEVATAIRLYEQACKARGKQAAEDVDSGFVLTQVDLLEMGSMPKAVCKVTTH